MLRRILAIAVIVLGACVIAAGVLSATTLRPSDVVTATTSSAPTEPLLVVEPGVLHIVDPQVRIELRAADPASPVVLAIGREADVRGWIGDTAHVQIDGLPEWEVLSSTSVAAPEPTDVDGEADGQAEEAASPAGSDMWVLEETGTGSVTLEWEVPEGRWLLLAATDGAEPAPQIFLTWTREVPTPLLVPAVVSGSVLALVGIVWLAALLLGARSGRRDSGEVDSAHQHGAESESAAMELDVLTIPAELQVTPGGPAAPSGGVVGEPVSAATALLPVVVEEAEPARPRTRREARAAEAAAAAAAKRAGRKPRPGAEPERRLPAPVDSVHDHASEEQPIALPAPSEWASSQASDHVRPSSSQEYPSWMRVDGDDQAAPSRGVVGEPAAQAPPQAPAVERSEAGVEQNVAEWDDDAEFARRSTWRQAWGLPDSPGAGEPTGDVGNEAGETEVAVERAKHTAEGER